MFLKAFNLDVECVQRVRVSSIVKAFTNNCDPVITVFAEGSGDESHYLLKAFTYGEDLDSINEEIPQEILWCVALAKKRRKKKPKHF